MKGFITGICQGMADFMTYIARIPTDCPVSNQMVTWVYLAVLLIVVLGLLTAVDGMLPGGVLSLNYGICMGTAFLPVMIAACSAVQKQRGETVFLEKSGAGRWIFLFFVLLAIAYLIFNIVQDMKKISVLLCTWAAVLLAGCLYLRAWMFLTVSGQVEQKLLLPVTGIAGWIASLTEKAPAGGFLLLVLLFIFALFTVLCWHKAVRMKGKYQKAAAASQVMVVASCLFFSGTGRGNWATLVVSIAAALCVIGYGLYCLSLFWAVLKRDRKGVPPVLFMGVAGGFGCIGTGLAAAAVRKSDGRDIFTGIERMMDWLYSHNSGSFFGSSFTSRAGVWMMIAAVLTIALLAAAFKMLSGVLSSLAGKNLSPVWIINSALLILVPLILHWAISVHGEIFGKCEASFRQTAWVTAWFGSAIYLANLPLLVIKGKVKQLMALVLPLAAGLAAAMLLALLMSILG